MKLINKNSITNIQNTDFFDEKYRVPYLLDLQNNTREVIYLYDYLAENPDLTFREKVYEKPAIFANIFSEKYEFEVFSQIVDTAISQKKYIHIVGVTLAAEINFIEQYYRELGFFDEKNNTFRVDFRVPYVTIGVQMDNLMWKGSDYKSQREKIFFCPPVRSSGENKALIKGITRGVVCGVHFVSSLATFEYENLYTIQKKPQLTSQYQAYLNWLLVSEKIFPLQFARVLYYNLIEAGFGGSQKYLELDYSDRKIAELQKIYGI